MKPLGDSIKDRCYEITNAANTMTYHLEKLTAQEALVAIDMVRQLVQNKHFEDMQPIGSLGSGQVFVPANSGTPLTGETTL